MARHKDQAARRQELLNAAVTVINDRGPAAVQMKDVARAANMATGSVYYYYDGIDELLREVHAFAYDRYLTRRVEAISGLDDPRAQLVTMIDLGLPRPEDIPLSLALYQVEVAKSRDPGRAESISHLCGSQRDLYVSILDRGVAAGQFAPVIATVNIAENLVSLEDGYGLALCAGKHGYTYEFARDLVLEAAAGWTSCPDLAAARRDA